MRWTMAIKGSNVYIIELSRWGIKNDSTDPVSTTQGISNALLWANQQGYNYVKLPKGSYLISKGTKESDKSTSACIHLQSNMTLDLQGCTLIKESNAWKTYCAIYGTKIKNTTIYGGILVGDRLTHTYSDASSIYEWCIGIEISGGYDNFIMDGMEIKDFSGYSVSLNGSAYQFRLITSSSIESGNINSSGMSVSSANHTRTTGYENISNAEPRLSELGYFMITGNGYNSYGFRTDGGGVNLTLTIFELHFYNNANVYLGKMQSRCFDPIPKDRFPVGATKFKISFRYDYSKIIPTTFFLGLDTRQLSRGAVIKNCKIHDSYALGIAMALTTQSTIENNEFYNIGFAMKDLGRHLYPFPMAIDIEDGYNANQQITIRNNIFRDNQSLHVNIVQARSVLVEGNKFIGTGGLVFQGSKGSNLLSRNNQYNLTSAQGESCTFVEFVNDHFIGANLTLTYKNVYSGCVFDQMVFQLDNYTYDVYTSGIPSRLGRTVLPTVKNGLYYVCTTTTELSSPEPIWNTVVGGTTTDASGNVWTGYKYDPTYEPLVFNDCKFNYDTPEASGVWLTRKGNVIFNNCDFKSNGGGFFSDNTSNPSAGDYANKTMFTFRNCELDMHGFGAIGAKTVKIINSKFIGSRDSSYGGSYIKADEIVIENSTFDNIDSTICSKSGITGSSLTFRDNTVIMAKSAKRFGDVSEGFYVRNIGILLMDRNRISMIEDSVDLRPFVIYVEDYFKFTDNFITSTRPSHSIELWGAKRVGGDITPIPSTVAIVDDNFFTKMNIKLDNSYTSQLRKTIGTGFTDMDATE